MGAFGVSLEVKGLRDLHREMSVSEFRVLGLLRGTYKYLFAYMTIFARGLSLSSV